jgi:hypothetical protein
VDEPRREAFGAAGRAAFLAHYERAPNCAAFEAVIEQAWAGAPVERRPATAVPAGGGAAPVAARARQTP